MDEREHVSKLAGERDTAGVPLRMRAIAPPLGALQDVNEVAGVEEAIVKEAPVESEAWMAAPDSVVHLIKENVHPVINVVVRLFVSAEMLMMGDDNSS